MIIDFSNNSGGGSYVLPVASENTLGGIKIGSGININSAGTVSVESQGIEVVQSLPVSGTDGQMVILVEKINRIIHISPKGESDLTVNATAMGITQATRFWKYEFWGEENDVIVNPNNSITITSNKGADETFQVGDTYTYHLKGGMSNDLTITVTQTGFSITSQSSIVKSNFIDDVEEDLEKQTIYTWSDDPMLTADLHYSMRDYKIVCYDNIDEFPSTSATLVTFVQWSWDVENPSVYASVVYENNELHYYDVPTATPITIAKNAVANYKGFSVFWNDTKIAVCSMDNYETIISFNKDAFKKNGWLKNVNHIEESKAFFELPYYFTENRDIILQRHGNKFYERMVNLNPQYEWGGGGNAFRVYGSDDGNSTQFFAPITTGTTGQVCIAGNGYAAPTWTNPENLTGGVKFWKGTQDEYDALSGTGYDSATLYIIQPE